jgi:arylsulfatase A-like enzyme
MDGRMSVGKDNMSEELPNIVLIVLDTARWDRFGCYGSGRGVTPQVDSLGREGRVVETMITNGPWTLPAHGSLFTGLYPSQHGSQWQTGPRLSSGVDMTLAEWLKRIGYRTVCATANNLVSSDTGLSRGFDHYVSKKALRHGRRWAARRAKNVVLGGDFGGRMLNKWLRQRLPSIGGPLFLFVNYLECHWPYVAPRRFERPLAGPRFGPVEAMRFRAGPGRRAGPWEAIAKADQRTLEVYSTMYDAELASADAHVAGLLDVLEETGFLEEGESVVMVTSDHGEHIGEHGLADHQASVDDHLVRVPFVSWGPGRIPTDRRSGLYELVDVFPSVCHLLQREPPARYLEERRTDLFSEPAGAEADGLAFGEWRAWAEEDVTRLARKNPSFDFSSLKRDLTFVRDSRFKLVRAGDGTEVLYDIVDDPEEETDASNSNADVLRRLGVELDRAIDSWRSWGTERQALSDQEEKEIEDHLSALGYI